MNAREDKKTDLRKLRERAEVVLEDVGQESADLTSEDMRRVAHELRTYQIELEIQNEDLRRAQADLELTRDEFSDLYDFAPVGYLTMTDKGIITKTNLTLAELLGVERADVTNRRLTEFIADDDQDIWYRYRLRLLETKKPDNCELRMRRNGDTRFWVALQSTVARCDDGPSISIRSTVADINDRRQAEDRLKASEEQYRLLVDNQTDMIVTFDRRGCLTFVSPSYCSTFGKSEAELLGKKFLPLIHEDDRDAVARATSAVGKPPYVGYVQERAMTAIGWRWQAWTNTGIPNEKGEIVEIVAVGRDVTDQKEAEAALRESEVSLLHAARLSELGELVAGIAHEINQPLYAVTNYARTIPRLLEADDPDAEEKVATCAAKLAEQAVRAGDIIRRLRQFVEKRAVAPSSIDLKDVVQDTLAMLEWMFRSHDVSVSVDLADRLPELFADQIQVQQVLVNLLSNACQSLSEIGNRKRMIRIRSETLGEFVVTSVADNGGGLSQEGSEKCFESFHTTKPDGIGIGLAICRSIVEWHGGQIWVVPNSQHGATFYFTLPIDNRRGC